MCLEEGQLCRGPERPGAHCIKVQFGRNVCAGGYVGIKNVGLNLRFSLFLGTQKIHDRATNDRHS